MLMTVILLVLLGILAVPTFIYLLEVVLALLPSRHLAKGTDIPSYAVLVPAHNEAGTIHKTLNSINQQLSKNDRLLVVADNCTDETADISRQYNAEVIERLDSKRKGKGYALDFGIRHLEQSPPEIVIVVDADCLLEEGALQMLAYVADTKNRPTQATYMMKYKEPGLKQRISEFAWQVKNLVRPLGLLNAGLPCQLMGTGMAFPWQVISTANLATNDIVEDMKMGLEMAMAGHAPVFLPAAKVFSTFPESSEAELSQRKRWEHGHLNLILTSLPGMLLYSITNLSKNAFTMALDLMVPPLSLLILMTSLLLFVSGAVSIATDSSMALVYAVILFFIQVLATFIAWVKWGREVVSFADLCKIPFYIVAKIPIYVASIFKRQKAWIRTDRD